jgi:hypothetical protein
MMPSLLSSGKACKEGLSSVLTQWPACLCRHGGSLRHAGRRQPVGRAWHDGTHGRHDHDGPGGLTTALLTAALLPWPALLPC